MDCERLITWVGINLPGRAAHGSLDGIRQEGLGGSLGVGLQERDVAA